MVYTLGRALALAFTAHALDLFTTTYFIKAGLGTEASPLVAMFIEAFGLLGVFISQAVSFILTSIILMTRKSHTDVFYKAVVVLMYVKMLSGVYNLAGLLA